MKFRTELHLEGNYPVFTHQTPILSMGSCFASTMGEKLHQAKFKTLANPFGIVFNPVSLCRQLAFSQYQTPSFKSYTAHFVQTPEQIWQHYDFHSSLGNPDRGVLEENILAASKKTSDFLENNSFCIFTLGTAYVYEYLDTQQVVTNCHKIPQQYFKKRLLSVNEIMEAFEQIASILKDKKVLLTVSPVRHLKDTLPLNSVSKSVLRLVCHLLEEQYEDFYYFPSYEYLLDDLRDYRFYKSDMLHPTQQAEDYIWEKFSEAFLSPATRTTVESLEKAQQMLAHRAFQMHTEAYKRFLKQLQIKFEILSAQIDVSMELEEIKQAFLVI